MAEKSYSLGDRQVEVGCPPSSVLIGSLPCLVRKHRQYTLGRANAKSFSPSSVRIKRPSILASERRLFCTSLTGTMPVRRQTFWERAVSQSGGGGTTGWHDLTVRCSNVDRMRRVPGRPRPSEPNSGARSWRWRVSPPPLRGVPSATGHHASEPMKPSSAALSRRFPRATSDVF